MSLSSPNKRPPSSSPTPLPPHLHRVIQILIGAAVIILLLILFKACQGSHRLPVQAVVADTSDAVDALQPCQFVGHWRSTRSSQAQYGIELTATHEFHYESLQAGDKSIGAVGKGRWGVGHGVFNWIPGGGMIDANPIVKATLAPSSEPEKAPVMAFVVMEQDHTQTHLEREGSPPADSCL